MALIDYLPASNQGAQFPSHLIDPKKKDKKWVLEYFKATYAQHRANTGYFSNERKATWIDARRYAQGNQSVQKYNKWASRLKDPQGRTVSYMDLNWEIVSVIPKFRDVLKGYFSKLQFRVGCTAINPEAALEKERAKKTIWASKKLKPFFNKLEAQAGTSFGTDSKMPFSPESLEELEIFFNLSFRLQEEISMELGQRMVFYENAWKDIEDKLWEDIIDLAAFGICVYVDRISRRIKVRYCDPVNMVLDTFRGHDGEAMERIGEFQLKTIAQLKLAAGNQFTEKEYYDMAYRHCGMLGNAERLSPYADYVNSDATNTYYPWDNFQILELELYFDSCNRIMHERKWVGGGPKKGVRMTFKKPFNTKIKEEWSEEDGVPYLQKEVVATDVKAVYGGRWIVGTDYIYDAGLINDISRPNDNPKEAMKPMKFYRISEKSAVEKMIPFADSLQMSWLKIQNLKARAIPKGIMIEVGAFENVALDGKIMSSLELLEVAVQSGIIIYRKNSTMDDDGYDQTNNKPVEETKGGLGAEFAELTQSMANDIMMCREVSGISEIFDASAQDPKQLVGTAKMALAGTQNALYPMVRGFVWMNERAAIDIGCKLQLLAKTGDIEGYAPALGSNVIQTIKIGSEISMVKYGYKIEALPTEDQKMRIQQAADMALANPNDPTHGGIDFSDYLAIGSMLDDGNIKLAQAYLSYKVRKFKEYTAKLQQDAIKSQGEQNQQLEASKAKAVVDTETAKTAEAIKLDDAITKNKMKLLKLEYELKAGLNSSDSQHRIRESKETVDLNV